MTNGHPGSVLPQDIVGQDGWDDMLTALPVSEAEIEELLYGGDRPPADRLERLQELAAVLRTQAPGDFGGHDPQALLGEIDRAVDRLNGGIAREPDLAFDGPTMDADPLAHRETLAPDSDELEDIEEADAASLSDETPADDLGVLDESEWDEGDFDTEHGVK